MDTYSGLCIGGPLDGLRLDSQSTKFEAVERMAPPLLSMSFDEAATRANHLAVRSIMYHYWPQGTGLWLLDGVDPEAAMLTMARKIGMTALASRYEQIMARRKDDAR